MGRGRFYPGPHRKLPRKPLRLARDFCTLASPVVPTHAEITSPGQARAVRGSTHLPVGAVCGRGTRRRGPSPERGHRARSQQTAVDGPDSELRPGQADHVPISVVDSHGCDRATVPRELADEHLLPDSDATRVMDPSDELRTVDESLLEFHQRNYLVLRTDSSALHTLILHCPCQSHCD